MCRVWRVEVATSADDRDGNGEAGVDSMAERVADGNDQRGKTIALSGGRLVAWKDRTRLQSGYHGSRRLQESRSKDETLMSYHQKSTSPSSVRLCLALSVGTLDELPCTARALHVLRCDTQTALGHEFASSEQIEHPQRRCYHLLHARSSRVCGHKVGKPT